MILKALNTFVVKCLDGKSKIRAIRSGRWATH